MSVVSGHLVLRHVPYVTKDSKVALGVLVSTLALAGEETIKPDTHVVSFVGEHPCHSNGAPIEQLRHSDQSFELTAELRTQRTFSNKPPEPGFLDYYAKMVSYVRILSNEARAIDPNATACTFAAVAVPDETSVFEYHDTNASRARVSSIGKKLANESVAIIGLGGTGSYVLDLVAKTPVREIHLFDGDTFVQHNAFRAPGAASREEIAARNAKVDHLKRAYSKMHRQIHAHAVYVDAENAPELGLATFAFICVDRPSAKPAIFRRLEAASIPFIDLGLGVEQVEGVLRGTVRATLSTPAMRGHVASRVSMGDGDPDEYSTNIQIAELNALNASLAVLRWKQLRGFYGDVSGGHHTQYMIEMNALVSDDHAT